MRLAFVTKYCLLSGVLHYSGEQVSDHFLHLMKLSMGRYPAVSVEVTLSTLIEVCKHYYDKDDALFPIKTSAGKPASDQDSSNAIYISDLDDTNETFSLLLVRGDPERGLPSFVNPKTRTVKTITSDEPGDVPGASAHIVISKQLIASGNDQGRHRMAMERTRGISKALARDFLTALMARYAEEFPEKFIAEKKRRNAKEQAETIQYRPTVSFNPQQNASLKKDLEEGRIGGFKLVRGSTEFQGEASEPKIQRLDVQLTARIAPTEDFSKVKKLIDHVRQTLDIINFEALNLELVDEGGQTIANTKAIEIDQLDQADMRYCKTVAITDLGDDVVECYAEFYQPIMKFAKKTLNTAKHWN